MTDSFKIKHIRENGAQGGALKKLVQKNWQVVGEKKKKGKKANFYAVNPKSKNQSNLHA